MSHQEAIKKGKLFHTLEVSAERLTREFDQIDPHRKGRLRELAAFISEKIGSGQKAILSFICTHNSRRSHMAQLWAQAAAHYYGVRDVACFSG